MRPLRLPAFLLFAALLIGGAPALACPGSGEGVLTISRSPSANPTETVVLDRACIESLPRHTLRTSTPWTEGSTEFEGVLMRDLLASIGFESDVVVMSALNDYRISAPRTDFDEYDVLVAFKQDGIALEIRGKGPFWVIYPLDDHPELANEQTYARMIWQLQAIGAE